MFRFIRTRARIRIAEAPTPELWPPILESVVPGYPVFSQDERDTLHRRIKVLLAEKRFAGCNGLELTESMRVTIAGLAALLMLRRDFDYFPRLGSILVYPDDFVTEIEEETEWGLVVEEDVVHSGESWSIGAVVLSWREIQRDLRRRETRNVVLHEFAHQVDQHDGTSDGWPLHLQPELRHTWHEVMHREYETLCERVDAGRRTTLDPYGATHPAEFFAVVTESFFLAPRLLRKNHEELYTLLAAFYGQDPAAREPATDA